VTTDRRKFLQLSAAAGGALALGVPGAAGATNATHATPLYRGLPDVPAADRALNILVLGGTGFTGPFQVRYAVARGHSVTVFNRGRRQAELPASVKHLTCDRNTGDVEALKGTEWDVVIDNPTSLPFWIRDAAKYLKGHTGQYVMISTISVYDPKGQTSVHEDSPLLEYTAGDPLAITPQQFSQNVNDLYGPMKTASERETVKQYGADKATIIRPGLIVGPGDTSFRFTYWPWRIERGGDIVVPAERDDAVQIIDARDLAEWTVRVAERRTLGKFNAAGPGHELSVAAMMHGIRAATGSDAKFVFATSSFLQKQGISAWSDLPAWVPGEGETAGFARVSNARAIAAGLTFRPLATTAADTLAWFNTLPDERRAMLRAGLPPEREAAALAAWHAQA
jgi:2'-hydroxyisoflavone reductase